jgi:hypothetical protein
MPKIAHRAISEAILTLQQKKNYLRITGGEELSDKRNVNEK